MTLLLVIANVLLVATAIFYTRHYLLSFILVVTYVVFLQPVLLDLMFGATHPLHSPRYSRHYETALSYILSYNFVLIATYLIFLKLIPRVSYSKKLAYGEEHVDSFRNLLIASAAILILGLLGKYSLVVLGAFRMLGEVTISPFLQLLKVIGAFDIMLIVYLGELKRGMRRSVRVEGLYAGIVGLSLVLALLSGSRSQVAVVILLVVIAHRDLLRKHVLLFGGAVLVVIPNLLAFFPAIGAYRKSYDLDVITRQVDNIFAERADVVLETLTTRLNYMEPFLHVIEFVRIHGPSGGAVYWNNLLGVIPRLIWADKPEISNMSRALGHRLGMVTRDDTATSIGLRVIGESFYELAWTGLVVAMFQAFLLAFIHKQFGYRNSVMMMSIYLFFGIHLATRDGYFAVLPGLIYIVISWVIFFVILRLFVLNRAPSGYPGRSLTPAYR